MPVYSLKFVKQPTAQLAARLKEECFALREYKEATERFVCRARPERFRYKVPPAAVPPFSMYLGTLDIPRLWEVGFTNFNAFIPAGDGFTRFDIRAPEWASNEGFPRGLWSLLYCCRYLAQGYGLQLSGRWTDRFGHEVLVVCNSVVLRYFTPMTHKTMIHAFPPDNWHTQTYGWVIGRDTEPIETYLREPPEQRCYFSAT